MSELEPTLTYSNPTATEILRRMLDDRGVEHYDGTESTLWGYEPTSDSTGAYRYSADETSDGYIQVQLWHVTPEQAIAATLGATDAKPTQVESSGTCHITDERPFWHRMAYEQPTDERGKYLLLGKRGAMYLANGFHVWEHSGRRSFYIPNNRSGYVDFDKVKAWAVVPEMEVEQ